MRVTKDLGGHFSEDLINHDKDKKNPAYGRQSISQLMRIVALIPKNLDLTDLMDNDLISLNLQRKNTFFCSNFTPFLSISFLFRDHFSSSHFHKDSDSLNIIDIQLWEMEGKKQQLNGTSKF